MKNRRHSRIVLPVATVAMTPDLDSRANRDRMKQLIEETKRTYPDIRLILFGETILGWFYNKDQTREYHESIAETVPGDSTAFIADLARTHDMYVSFGLSEKDNGKLYNTQVLISPEGNILAKHREFKIRNRVFTAGDGKLTLATIDGVKTAILICADARSLPLMRAIRRERVDLMLASLADYATSRRLNQLMGAFYDAWTVVANRYGEEGSILWHGLVTMTDPWARLRASGLDKQQVLVHRLTISNVRGLGRWFRRTCVGFKFIAMATVLTIQMVWTSMQKKARKRQ